MVFDTKNERPYRIYPLEKVLKNDEDLFDILRDITDDADTIYRNIFQILIGSYAITLSKSDGRLQNPKLSCPTTSCQCVERGAEMLGGVNRTTYEHLA